MIITIGIPNELAPAVVLLLRLRTAAGDDALLDLEVQRALSISSAQFQKAEKVADQIADRIEQGTHHDTIRG